MRISPICRMIKMTMLPLTMLSLTMLLLTLLAGSSHAQVAIGDTQMTAWRQMRGFGLHLDSVVENGKVRIYTADSIRIAGLLNHVTIQFDDSQRVSRLLFEARDIDTALFAAKYQLMLTSPRVVERNDDGGILKLKLVHPKHIVDLRYDRAIGYIREEDLPIK